MIAMLFDDDILVSVAALKNPLDSYRKSVFDSAGVEGLEVNYKKELGYIVTHPQYEGRKLCQLLLHQLFPKINASNMFATTRKTAMIHILSKFGFKIIGEKYKGDLQLLVYDNSLDK